MKGIFDRSPGLLSNRWAMIGAAAGAALVVYLLAFF